MRGLKLVSFAVILAALVLNSHRLWAYSNQQFAQVTNAEENQIETIRDQEINQIKIVLGRRFNETRRPDILLRLAELYVEKYRFYSFKENEIYQNLIKAGQRVKTVEHQRSRSYLKSATNACLAILKSNIHYPKLDQVYYFLAYNAEESDNHKAAKKYFEIMIQRYPQSIYAAEAYRSLAEIAFSEKKYGKSVELYEQAVRFTKVPSYPRTLYKLAWSYFKVRQKTAALNTMKKVIEVSGKSDKFIALKEEALNDLVLFFSEAGNLSDARDYFHSISGGAEVYTKALNKLSRQYESRGDAKLALKVNEKLIEEFKDKNPEYVQETLSRNIEIYRRSGDFKAEEQALLTLVQILKKSKNSDDAVYIRTKAYLRTRATDLHQQARKTEHPKKPAAFARAAGMYQVYLDSFLSSGAERAEIQIYLADALLAADRKLEAQQVMLTVLKEGNDSKFQKEAGTSLLNLLIQDIDKARNSKQDTRNLEKRFIEVSELYAKNFSNDKLIAELEYKKARLIADRSGPEGLTKDARESLTDLVEKFPNRHESAEAAYDLVQDLLKKNKKDQALDLAKKFLANSTLLAADKKGELKNFLEKVLVRDQFEEVQSLEKKQDYFKAAQEYERLAQTSQRDQEVVAKSLNNAAVNFEKARAYNDSFRCYVELLKRFPQKNHNQKNNYKEDLKRLANIDLWQQQFHEAAQKLIRLSEMNFYSQEEKFNFLQTAFTVLAGTKYYAEAHIVAMGMLNQFCSKNEFQRCHRLTFDLAEMLENNNKLQEATNLLKHYLRQPGANLLKAEANFRLAMLYQAAHEDRKARAYLEEASAVSVLKKSQFKNQEKNYAAHAAFLLVDNYFKEFLAIKLQLPESQLKELTKKKLQKLESLVTRYTSVLQYGDGEWGIAALQRLYDAFALFAQELEQTPLPNGLNEQQKNQYRQGIMSVAKPMADKAQEYLKQAYQKGLALEVTTPTFIALAQRLARRHSSQYPPAHFTLKSGLKLMSNDNRTAIVERLLANPKDQEGWLALANQQVAANRFRLARLFYEQVLALNSKNASALNNIAILLFNENKPFEAREAFKYALEFAEFNQDLKLNYAKFNLVYHHFQTAAENLKPLLAKNQNDADLELLNAIALLGQGQIKSAWSKLNDLGAKSSDNFNLWYNYSVASILSRDQELQKKGRELALKRSEGLSGLEKSQADLILAIEAML